MIKVLSHRSSKGFSWKEIVSTSYNSTKRGQIQYAFTAVQCGAQAFQMVANATRYIPVPPKFICCDAQFYAHMSTSRRHGIPANYFVNKYEHLRLDSLFIMYTSVPLLCLHRGSHALSCLAPG